MHIPDGLLSPPVAIACAALSAGAVAGAAAKIGARKNARAIARTGVTAAFVFAAQMLSFPVAGGTSGHLIGGVLAAVLLGPSSAVLAMTAVLVLQCLAFGDGGLLSLGANVLNMAVVHPLVGFAAYRVVAGRARNTPLGQSRRIAAVAFGSWLATVVAAATCAGELTLSRIVAPAAALPAMLGVHAVVGLGEALISAFVLATVIRLRPEMLVRSGRADLPRAPFSASLAMGLATSLSLALFVSPFACTWPDGLERVVEHLGIQPSAASFTFASPLRGYAVPWISGAVPSAAAAAAFGTLLVFGLCVGVGLCLAPGRRPPPARGLPPPPPP
ncbi:MAG: energy-coupling factor ABC transporter permease [Polyangiaceae bacterium]